MHFSHSSGGSQSRREVPLIALAGNPNVGKTSILNALTEANFTVGNWPGVTVEKREGRARVNDQEVLIVDLPGSYSLTPHSLDQKIAREFLVEEKPDLVLNIINSASLERNLYLTIELIELGIRRIVLVLNMVDEAERRGISIDERKLSQLMGLPAVRTVANKCIGIDVLRDVISRALRGELKFNPTRIEYSRILEEAIEEIKRVVERYEEIKRRYPPRWVAIALLERDRELRAWLRRIGARDVLDVADRVYRDLERKLGHDPESYIAEERYRIIDEIVREVIRVGKPVRTLSERIDLLLLRKEVGFPVFLGVMASMFWIVFRIGDILSAAIEDALLVVSKIISGILAGHPMMASLLVDGVIGGVGTMLTLIPYVLGAMLFVSLLEDIGYMARFTVLTHDLFSRIGLHGRSSISYVLALGCNVPAVVSTRTIENIKQRLLTIITIPLVPCSARLSVLVFLAATFFSHHKTFFIISIYAFSVSLAMLVASVAGRIIGGERAELLIELPPMRMPDLGIVWRMGWLRTKHFIQKLFTVVLVGSIFFWFLTRYPAEIGTGGSLAEMMGRALEPLARLMGLDWRAAVALMMGVIAKELVISSYAILYGVGEEGLVSILRGSMTPLQVYTLALVMTLYLPCVATLAAIKAEAREWRWVLATILYNLILATLVGILFYQIASLIV